MRHVTNSANQNASMTGRDGTVSSTVEFDDMVECMSGRPHVLLRQFAHSFISFQLIFDLLTVRVRAFVLDYCGVCRVAASWNTTKIDFCKPRIATSEIKQPHLHVFVYYRGTRSDNANVGFQTMIGTRLNL